MNAIGEIILVLLSIIIYISISIFSLFTFFIVLPMWLLKVYYWLCGNFEKSSQPIFKNDKGKFSVLWVFYFIGLVAILIPIIFHNGIVINFYTNYLLRFN